jgi:hypothetical protein
VTRLSAELGTELRELAADFGSAVVA